MAEERFAPRRTEWGRFLPFPEEDGGLWRWVFFSGLLHLVLITSSLLVLYIPIRTAPSYPVYTVDLVGGEKIGGPSLGSVVARGTEPKKEVQKPKAESPPPQKIKEVKKKEVKEKVAERVPQMEEKVAVKKPKKETKKESQAEQETSDQVRESLIRSAVERLKSRAEGEQKNQKAEVMSSGPGEGVGAPAKGEGGLGGGVVKSLEFLRYLNQMRDSIRQQWVWAGKRSDLEVIVRFGIQENGEIVGLKIVKRSGDASYDDSVTRAVRQASPLPPPPEKYREDFKDVELKFLPKDLGG
jgi:colicin import membrane protein